MIVHAGLLAKHDGGQWRGALIQGSSGGGKSDLALRALDVGFRLVADDRVRLFVAKGRVFGSVPSPLIDLLEMRGFGLVRVASLRLAEIRLVVSCVEHGAAERLPPPAKVSICGYQIPTVSLTALEPSAPAKLCHALRMLGSEAQQAYDPAFP